VAPASTALAKVLGSYQGHLAQNWVVLQHSSEVLFALARGFLHAKQKPNKTTTQQTSS